MTRAATRAWIVTLSGLLLGVAPLACSTDGRGLGDLDAGSASGGRVGTGSGGSSSGGGGSGGSGAMTGSGSGGTIGAGTGGTATDTGGMTGTGSGGAGTGGRAGNGSGGTSTGGRPGSGGAMSTGGTAVGGGGRGGIGGTGFGGRVGTGGSNTGGAATGGAATGGRIGTGGANTGGRVGSGGVAGSQPECTRDSDCDLVNDCCTCAGIRHGQNAPSCGLVCIQNKCNAQGLPVNAGAACVAGRCVAGFNCDDSNVTCRVATPFCMDGQVPGLNADGTCYTGGCVPVTQCTSVANCAVCGSTLACVNNQSRGRNEHHCVTIPAGCNNANCSCLGDSVCISPYTSCDNTSSGGAKGVTCGCPTC